MNSRRGKVSKKRLYLCGGGTWWRALAKRELVDQYDTVDTAHHGFYERVVEDAKKLIAFDIGCLQTCDTMLVDARSPDWGTAMEVFIGAQMEKRSVAVVDPNRSLSPWLVHHVGIMVPTLSSAFNVLKGLANT